MDCTELERHRKQNKEIIRVNQIQSGRIVTLEAEVSKLLSENIQLRTQVIQLTHKQDLSAQRAQIERKVRELHRLVKTFGDVASSSSPAMTLRKSPKKTNLLNLHIEHHPESETLDSVNPRGRPRILGSPVTAVHQDEARHIASISTDVPRSEDFGSPAIEPNLSRDERREMKERERAREARRSSRRMSRASDEIIPLPQSELAIEQAASASPVRELPQALSSSSGRRDRTNRKSSRSSMSFDVAPLFNASQESARLERRGTMQAPGTDSEDDKENAPSERRSTASIRLLHSSPSKKRTALNLIADPLPSANIQAQVCTPSKPLKEVQEVKSEPTSPSLDHQEHLSTINAANPAEELGGRSRRAKSINYAEPSLRHKMRRTETLPGDKRRKSSYRRTSSSIMDEARRSAQARETITIIED